MTASSDRLPRAWLVVAVLWVVAALNYLDRNMVTTMRGSILKAIPMSEADFGSLTMAFLIAYGLFSPIGGFMADRLNRCHVIIGSLLLWSILTWLTGCAKSYWQLVTVRALMGLSEAAYIPAALALITDYHRGGTRSLATGIHMTGLSAGAGLAGVGGHLAERYGWHVAFNVFGLFGVLYALVLVFFLREAPATSEHPTLSGSPKVNPMEALSSLLTNRSFLLLMAYWTLFGLAGWAVMGWMPTYFQERFLLSQSEAGYAGTGYLAGGMLCGKLIGGAWADSWSRTNSRARMLVPAIGMFLAAPAALLVATTDVFVLAVVGLVVFGLMRSFSDANLMPVLCTVADPRYRATGYGLLNTFSTIVGGLTIYVGGMLRDKVHSGALGGLFMAAAAALLLCGFLMLFVKPSLPAPAGQ